VNTVSSVGKATSAVFGLQRRRDPIREDVPL
jgi:hypothetical protein